MNKYATLFGLSWQRQLEVRSDFLFERIRSLSILFSLYFLWSALLIQQDSVLGYTRDQLLTYVLVMTLLRAWVLGAVSDRIPQEIAKGRLTDVLLRPLSHLSFWIVQDAANKTLNLISAIFEISLFMLLWAEVSANQADQRSSWISETRDESVASKSYRNPPLLLNT